MLAQLAFQVAAYSGPSGETPGRPMGVALIVVIAVAALAVAGLTGWLVVRRRL
jgi:hypothetical protein